MRRPACRSAYLLIDADEDRDDGSMSGTATGSGQTFTWVTTFGHAAPIPTTGSWVLYAEPGTAYSVMVRPVRLQAQLRCVILPGALDAARLTRR